MFQRKSVNELIYSRLQSKKKGKVQNSIKVINHSDSFTNDSSEDEEGVNDSDIIEDAIENAQLVYYPVSPEAKKMVHQIHQRRERKGTVSNMENMELPTFYHCVVTMGFLISVFAVSIFAQNIGQVNSILSSTMLPIVCFIFPFLICLKTDGASKRMKALTCFTAVLSVLNAAMFFYNLLAN